MKLSKAKAKLLRFDIDRYSNDHDFDVDLTNTVEVVDYLNPGEWTVVVIWKINVTSKIDGTEAIGMLHQSTAVATNILQYEDDDVRLITKLLDISLDIATHEFNDRVQHQAPLPQIDTGPIALYLLSKIRSQAMNN